MSTREARGQQSWGQARRARHKLRRYSVVHSLHPLQKHRNTTKSKEKPKLSNFLYRPCCGGVVLPHSESAFNDMSEQSVAIGVSTCTLRTPHRGREHPFKSAWLSLSLLDLSRLSRGSPVFELKMEEAVNIFWILFNGHTEPNVRHLKDNG